MSEQAIQYRLNEISQAFDVLQSVRGELGGLKRSAEQLVKGADRAQQRTARLLAGSAQGIDSKVANNLQQAAEGGKMFLHSLEGVIAQIQSRKDQLQEERERLYAELRAIRQAEAASRRRY